MRYTFTAEDSVIVRTAEAETPRAAPKKPEAPTAKPEEEIVTLPPMTVTASPLDATSYNVFDATTATKTDTPIMETPVSIQVIPQQVLKDQQVFTLKDALENVSGARIDVDALGTFSFRLRGFPDAPTFRNQLAVSAIDTNGEFANVERVEVLKGPASILYGRVEPGGLINLVTRQPRAEPYYALQQQFGSFDFYRTTAEATGPLTADGSLRYGLDFSYQNSHSFRDFESKDNVFVAPVLSWTITPETELTLDFEYLDSTNRPAGGIPVIGNRPAPLPLTRNLYDPTVTDITTTQWLVGARLSHAFTPEWKLALRFATAQHSQNRQLLLPFQFNADNPNRLDRFLSRSPDQSSNTYSTNLTGRFATGSLIHQVLLGVDYYRQDGEDAAAVIFDGIPTIDINDPVYGVLPSGFLDSLRNTDFSSSEADQYGLYFQDDILLWDKVHLLGGGRYDWASIVSGFSGVSLEAAEAEASEVTDEAFSPRVGLLYQPRPWLSLYGHYAESFGVNEGQPAPDNPPFPPETATQYEVGVKTSFFDDALTGTLAFFDLTKQNVLTADVSTPDPFDQRPVGEQRSRGIELDISGQMSEGLSLIASYAYTDTEVTKDDVQLEDGTVTRGNTGNRFIDAPRNAGSVFATYGFQQAPLQGLKLGGGLFAVGQREGNLENTFQLPGYVRVDAVAAYEWIVGPSKITAQLNVRNLLDKDYFEAADTDIGGSAVPGASRTFLGSVGVEF